jgi:hypothetical protein
MAASERLPWRDDLRVVQTLGVLSDVEICPAMTGVLPLVRGTLSRPLPEGASFTVRVHSRSGIPLAFASVRINPGDSIFEAPLTLLAMEGYSHLSPRARQEVERRVWSRRAYVTGSAT